MTSKIHSILPRIAIWSLLAIPVAGIMLYRSWTSVYEVKRGGEMAVAKDSQPVVWDLVLKSPNSYTWRRTDWAGWMHTPLVRRCPRVLTGLP